MAIATVIVPYDEFVKLNRDSADKAAVIELLKTEFPDDTCQLIAIKSVLGVKDEEEVEEPEEPVVEPDDSEPSTEPSTDDTP